MNDPASKPVDSAYPALDDDDALRAPHPALLNPYAPPSAAGSTERPAGRGLRARPDVLGRQMIGLYFAVNGLAIVLDIAVLSGSRDLASGALASLAASGIGVAWLYRRWAALPEAPHALGTSAVTALGAVGYLFVPFFNLFWIFRVHTALRGAVNAEVAKRAADERAPAWAAMVAPLLQVLCSVFVVLLAGTWLVLVPIVARALAWGVHMLLVERAWAYRRRSLA